MRIVDAGTTSAPGTTIAADPGFAEEIRRRSGENVFLCYQCRKCASGCPAREFMDATPAQLMRYAQLGLKARCLKGNTVWFCSSCQTCTTRCPAGIDIAHVVDTIKIIAQEKGVKTDTRNAKTFNFLWMQMLERMGRIYEAGLAGALNLAAGSPLKDAGLAVKMLKKGKLGLLPRVTRPLTMMRMFSRARKVKQ